VLGSLLIALLIGMVPNPDQIWIDICVKQSFQAAHGKLVAVVAPGWSLLLAKWGWGQGKERRTPPPINPCSTHSLTRGSYSSLPQDTQCSVCSFQSLYLSFGCMLSALSVLPRDIQQSQEPTLLVPHPGLHLAIAGLSFHSTSLPHHLQLVRHCTIGPSLCFYVIT